MRQLHTLSSSFAGDPSRDPYVVPRYFAWLALSRLSDAVLGRGPEGGAHGGANDADEENVANMSTWTMCLQVFYDNINLISNSNPSGGDSHSHANSTIAPAWIHSDVLTGFRSRFAEVHTRMVRGLHGAISRLDIDSVAALTWLTEACSATSNPWASLLPGSVPSTVTTEILTQSILELVTKMLQTHKHVLRFEGARLALMVVNLGENPHQFRTVTSRIPWPYSTYAALYIQCTCAA